MCSAGRNQVIPNRSLIDTMRIVPRLSYGGACELSIVRMTNVLAFEYLDDYA